MDALSIVGIPTTHLIDRDGREIGRMTGAAQWDAAESVKRISKIIGRLSRFSTCETKLTA
jgi:hypothetical protein